MKLFLTAYRNKVGSRQSNPFVNVAQIGIAQLDTCYSLFGSRISVLRDTSLPADWDGSYAMTERSEKKNKHLRREPIRK